MTNTSKPNIRVVFLSQSKRQTEQYKSLCKKVDMQGSVINIKHPGLMGSFIHAGCWLIKNRSHISSWIELEVEKNKARSISMSFFSKKILILRIYRVLARVVLEFKRTKSNMLFVRNGASYRQKPIIDWCDSNSIKIAYIENGFLPSTIQLDGRGVNCNNSIPRSADFYMSFVPDQRSSPAKTLVQRASKIKDMGFKLVELPKKYYFVPFQVPTDTQVLLNSKWIKSMGEFYGVLEKSIGALPEGFKFLVKEHPSASVRLDELYDKNDKIVFANNHTTQDLVEKSEAVITLNSTVGVESLLLGRPVITLGDACYNIDGLVTYVDNLKDFQRVISKPHDVIYNKVMVSKFISWLGQEYLISGKLREFENDQSSCEKVIERVEDIFLGKFQ